MALSFALAPDLDALEDLGLQSCTKALHRSKPIFFRSLLKLLQG
jgi:hypothetical protein